MFEFKLNNKICRFDEKNFIFVVDKNKYSLSKANCKSFSQIKYLKLNSACNLKCVYCFQKKDKKKNIYNSSFSIDELEFIFSEENNKYILFGGEPFIEQNLEIVAKLIDIAKEKKIKFDAFSNGCYTKKVKQFLMENINCFNSFTITVDGPEEIHNQMRIYPNGNSYKKIMYNLNWLFKEKITIFIQINVNEKNVNTIEKLCTDLLIKFPNQEIKIILNRILHENHKINNLKFLEISLYLVKNFKQISFEINLPTLIKVKNILLNNGIDCRRCAINDTKIYDFQNGNIYACPQNVNSLIGTFSSNKEKYDYKQINNYLSYVSKKESICNKCSLSSFCSYGCLLDEDLGKENCQQNTREELQFIFNNFEDFIGYNLDIYINTFHELI